MAMIKCSECKSDVSNKASSCPKCGAPITITKVAQERAALNQAKLNEQLSGPFMVQILIVAGALGWYEKSWPYFGGSFLRLFVLLMIPYVGRILSFLLAGAFAFIGYQLGIRWWGTNGGYVLGGLFFMMSLAASIGGTDYMRDISTK